MPAEKIPYWIGEFSSLTPKINPIILQSEKCRIRNYFEDFLPDNDFSSSNKQKGELKADNYQYPYKIIGDLKDRFDCSAKPHIEQQPLNKLTTRLKQLVALGSLSCLCGLGMGCSKSAPSLPIGGAFPDPPASLPKLAPNRLGIKQWFDNRRGTHPLTDLPNIAMKGFCHPLQGRGFLSQGTRGRTHQGRMKYAYDFGVPIGMPVYAMQSGRVIGLRDIYPDNGGRRKNASKFNFIWLEHTNGVRSAYIHLQQNFKRKVPIKLNDWVRTGELIGYSGNSGWSSAPHLHVEVHSISDSGFGQTLPFIIASKCYRRPFASVRRSS